MNRARRELAAEERGGAAFWYFPYLILIKYSDSRVVELVESFLPLIEELAAGSNLVCLTRSREYLSDFIAKAAITDKNELDRKLNVDYTTLFSSGLNCVRSSESAWLSPEGLIMQEPWDQIVDLYTSWGFKKPDDCMEPEDHVGLELLFLSALSNTAAGVIDSGEAGWEVKYRNISAAREKFIKDHLGKWVGNFSREVVSRSEKKLALYAGAALLAEGLTEIYGNSKL